MICMRIDVVVFIAAMNMIMFKTASFYINSFMQALSGTQAYTAIRSTCKATTPLLHLSVNILYCVSIPLPAVLMVFFERSVFVFREGVTVIVVTVLASEPHAFPFTITVVATDGTAIGTNDMSGSQWLKKLY